MNNVIYINEYKCNLLPVDTHNRQEDIREHALAYLNLLSQETLIHSILHRKIVELLNPTIPYRSGDDIIIKWNDSIQRILLHESEKLEWLEHMFVYESTGHKLKREIEKRIDILSEFIEKFDGWSRGEPISESLSSYKKILSEYEKFSIIVDTMMEDDFWEYR